MLRKEYNRELLVNKLHGLYDFASYEIDILELEDRIDSLYEMVGMGIYNNEEIKWKIGQEIEKEKRKSEKSYKNMLRNLKEAIFLLHGLESNLCEVERLDECIAKEIDSDKLAELKRSCDEAVTRVDRLSKRFDRITRSFTAMKLKEQGFEDL